MDKAYGTIPKRKEGHICALCGHFGFTEEMTLDTLGSVGFDKDSPEALNWIHRSCRTVWYRDEREECRHEEIMDKIERT